MPWLLALLAVAVLPAFLGEAHFASLGYSLLYQWTPERRLLDYLRYLGASDDSAKEVKLFGLSDFLVGRYSALSDEFYREEQAPRGAAQRRVHAAGVDRDAGLLRAPTSSSFTARCWAASRLARSRSSPASFRQSRDLIQRVLLSLSQIYEQSLYLSDLFTFFDVQAARRDRKPDARPVPVPIRDGLRVSTTWASTTRARAAGRCAT